MEQRLHLDKLAMDQGVTRESQSKLSTGDRLSTGDKLKWMRSKARSLGIQNPENMSGQQLADELVRLGAAKYAEGLHSGQT